MTSNGFGETGYDFDTDILGGLTADTVPDTEWLAPDVPNGAADIAEPDYAQPDTGLITQRQRSTKAKQYEKKIKGVLSAAFRVTAAHPATVPDAATILVYGPNWAEKAGDLAGDEPWFARGVDMFTEGTENSRLAFLTSSVIMALQFARNHEPTLQPNPDRAGFRIPFAGGRRFKIKWGIKLGRVRELTHDPVTLTDYVFSNPAVIRAMEKQGIHVGSPDQSGKRQRR